MRVSQEWEPVLADDTPKARDKGGSAPPMPQLHARSLPPPQDICAELKRKF